MAEGAWIALAGVILTALLSVFGVMIGQLYARVARLEGEVKDERDYTWQLWQWARAHIDLYYRHRKTGAPDPHPIPERDGQTS